MRINEILEEIKRAYPEDIFPSLTKEEIDRISKEYPGFIDRASASMGRHLEQVIRRKLSEKEDIDEELYNFTYSDLILPYTEFKELVNRVKGRLSEAGSEWLAEWDLWDLAVSPMDDNERRFIRWGHYLGWMSRSRNE